MPLWASDSGQSASFKGTEYSTARLSGLEAQPPAGTDCELEAIRA